MSLRSVLAGTYRRNRADSSLLAKFVGRHLRGQIKHLEHLSIGEHDVVCDPAVGYREDLKRVQSMPAAGLRRVCGERGLPVGGEVSHAPACFAWLAHTLHEQSVVRPVLLPQRYR